MGAFFSLFSSSSEINETNTPLLDSIEEEPVANSSAPRVSKGNDVAAPRESKGNDVAAPRESNGDIPPSAGVIHPTGGPKKISIITSHQGRMRCFLNMMKNNVSAKKFKNGAIVKVTISKGGCTIELVYEGELVGNTNDSKYYNHNNKYTKKYEFSGEIYTPENYKEPNLILCNLTRDDTIDKLGLVGRDVDAIQNNTYIFYLVRHGYAEHNARRVNLVRDTGLKDEGKKQAVTAGKLLKYELGEINPKYIRYYTSDLHRTIQTMAYIMHELGAEQSSEMTVLPCNHEIDSTKSPCIDESMWRSLPVIRRENKTLKKSELLGEIEIPIIKDTDEKTDEKTDEETIKYEVNWNLYNGGEKGKKRKKNKECIGQIFVTTAFRDFLSKTTDVQEDPHIDVLEGDTEWEAKTAYNAGGGKTQKRKKIRRKRTKRRRSKKTHNKRKTKRRSKKRKLKVTKSQKLKKLNEGINH